MKLLPLALFIFFASCGGTSEYAGSYTTDAKLTSPECACAITITSSGSNLSYQSDGPGKEAHGPVTISKEEDGLYFTFKGWKQLKSDIDVTAFYEPGKLTIMNYSNYSEAGAYQLGGGCDAKWIVLVKN